MKIMVIGYASSGKSTFAKRLSELYDYPLLHVDKIAFLPNWVARERNLIEIDLREFMKNENWVIDGLYRHIAPERYDMTDQIFIFDFNRFKCLYGAIYRRIKYHKKSRDSIADGCKERLNLSFIWWILFSGRTRASKRLLKDISQNYKDKTIVFKNYKQVNGYLLENGYKGSLKYE